MIMKLKYIGMLLTSLGLVTAVAAVPAQQDRRPHDATKLAVPVRDEFSQDAARDLVVEPAAQRPGYDSDENLVGPGGFSYFGQRSYSSIPHGERGKLSAAEGALAREAVTLRNALEHAHTDRERSDARTKLAENLGKQFDLRQKRHGLEIEALETQVKKLKELVRKRQESREDIISRRVDQILREVDGLGW
jgi:hypothetical protein